MRNPTRLPPLFGNTGTKVGILLAVGILLSTGSAYSQAGNAQNNATDPRHETLSQRVVSVLFDQNIQAAPVPSINGWTVRIDPAGATPVTVVTINSLAVVGNRVNITIDAIPAHAGQSFIIPGDVVDVSYNAGAVGSNTLTATVGNPEINSFGPFTSKNNFAFACGEMIFFQQGVYPGASVDVCSPVVMNFFQFQYRISLRFRNSSAFSLGNVRYFITWGDAVNSTEFPYVSDLLGAPSPNFIDATGFTGANPAIVVTSRPVHNYPAPNPVDCSFNMSLLPLVVPINCPGIATTNLFATYDNDNANSGTLSMPASVANSDRVCLGTNVNMQFTDATTLNCRAAIEPLLPNDQTRWIRIVYGNRNSPTAQGNIRDIWVSNLPLPNIPVGPRQVTNAVTGVISPVGGYYPTGAGGPGVFNIPDFNGVIELPTPVTAATALAFMKTITTTTTVNHAVGQRFYVRLDYWDICNPYNPGSPDANRVSIENYIEIITKPASPVAVNKEYCFTEALGSGGTCGAPTGEYFEVTAASVAGSTEIKWYNSLADATADINAIVPSGAYGTNCRFLRPENRAGGTGAMAAAGVYPVFVRHRTGAGPPNNCLSDPVQVTITRRSSLSTPGAITPLTSDVCNLTNNVAYSLGSPPPVVPVGGATEYFWSFSGGAGATVDAPGTTQNITADYNVGGAFVSVTRSLDVVTRFTTTVTSPVGSQCATTPSSRTVTIYGVTLGGTTSGAGSFCEGTDIGAIDLAGHRGSVIRWEVSVNGGAFVDAGLGTATTVNPGVLPIVTSPSTTYTYHAVVANGPCANANSTTVTATIFEAPLNSAAGPDQALCQVMLSTPLAGSDPTPGMGTWTRVSGPGAAPTFAPNANTPNATVTVFANGIHVFRWTVNNGGQCVTQDDVSVDFGTAPAMPNAGGDQDVCGLVATLAGSSPTFETGTWSQTAGPGVTAFTPTANTPGATATVTLPGTYTFRWRFTSGICVPADDFVQVIFRDPPVVTGPADFTFCVDNPPTVTIPLSGTFGGGATQAQWERVVGTGTFTSNGTAIGNFDNTSPATDSYTPTAADFAAGSVQVRLVSDDPLGSCASVLDVVNITIDRKPSNANAGMDFAVCGTSGALAATAADNGGTGTWSIGGAIYYETFPAPDNGLGIAGPPVHATNFNHPGGNWSVQAAANNQFLDNQDWIKVDNGRMSARDVNLAEVVWQSSVINITAFPSVSISAEITELGNQTGADYVRVFYKINGGAEVQFGAVVGDLIIDGQIQTVTATGLSGNTLQVVMRARNDGLNDYHTLDNVFVSSTTSVPNISDIHDPAATVSNLSVGATTFTWTVTSALGVCSSTNDPVVVTRHALPVANDPLPQLCEDSFGLGEGTVTPAFLAGLSNTVNGGNPLHTVAYFSDAARTIPIVANFLASNSEVIYTRVTRTDVTPNCTQDGIVTFAINGRPIATNQNPEFCEETFGSADKDNVDLTANNTALAGGSMVNRTVAWFIDAGLTTPVPVPTDVDDVTNNETFFALVTNTVTGCTNTASAIYSINPRPILNPLTGPANVCSGTSIILFQITNIIPGTTYSWTLPPNNPGFFQRFAGGGVNDFFVLLQFPALTAPPASDVYNFSVIETSADGCAGPPNNFTVTVNDAPPANVIAGPDPVCKNQTGVTYQVVPNPLSNFSWSITAGDAAIVGPAAGPNLFQITVDFGTTASSTIQVIETSGSGCVGAPATLIVNANDQPVGAADVKTICSDANVAYDLQITNINGLGNGLLSTFSWIATANPNVTGESTVAQAGGTINDALSNVTGSNQVVIYTVTPTSLDGCQGNPFTVSVTVQPEPVGSNDTRTICSDANVNYNLQTQNINALGNGLAAAFSWVAAANGNVTGESTVPVNSGTITDVLNNITASDEIVVYTVTPTSTVGGCLGSPFTVSVTVRAEPVGAADVKTICSDGSVNYNLQVTNINALGNGLASTFSWVAASNANVSGESTTAQAGGTITDVLNNVTGSNQTVVYTVTPTSSAGGCAGNPFTVTVTVQPEPLGANDTRTICSDASVNYDLQVTNINALGNGIASTFSWVAAPNANVSGETTVPVGSGTINDVLNNVTAANQTVVYTVTPTAVAGTCAGNPFTVTVTVQPEPVGANDVAAICSDAAVNYNLQNNITTLGNGIVSTFSWVAAANANVSGESVAPVASGTITDALNNVTGSDQVVVYTVTPTSAGCTGNPFTVSVTVRSEPVGTNDVKTICSDASVAYDLQNNVNATGNNQTSNFLWQAAANPNVTGESTAAQAGGTITDVLNNVTNAGQTVIYTVTPTGTNGCAGNAFTIAVTVNPEPVGVNDTKTICSDANVSYNLQNNVNLLGNNLASTFSWVAAANANVTGESTAPQASGTISDVLNNVTSSDQTVIYTVTPTSTAGGCAGNPFTVTVTVRAEPVGANDVASTCSDVALAYNLQNNINTLGNGLVSSFSWIAAANPNVSGESTVAQATGTIADVLNNITGSDQVVVYTVTPTSGSGCLGDPFTVSVTVRPEPVGLNDVATICSDGTLNYNLQNNVTTLGNNVTSNFTWVAASNASVTGESTVAQAGGTITDILNNVTNANQVVTYTVNPTGTNGCAGNPFTITVTVQPEPQGANDTRTICSDASVNYNIQTANINTLGNSLASNFSWVAAPNGNVTGESTVPQATGTINDILNNITSADETVIYTITPTSTIGACIGNPFTLTVTIRAEPSGANDVATASSDVAFNYNLQNNINTLGNGIAATFTWVAASNVNVTGESTAVQAGGTINDIINNVTGIDQVVVYTVTPTSGGGCQGNTFTVTVTVRSEPVGVNDVKTIASDDNVNYDLQNNINTFGNGQNSTFVWVATPNPNVTGESTAPQAGGTLIDVLNNVTTADQVVVYTVTPTGANGVLGNPFTITITVRPEPVGQNDTKTICGNSNVNYDLQNNINVFGNGLPSTFSWVATANPNVSGESTASQATTVINDVLINVTNADQVVVYTVVPTGTNGSVGNQFTVTVTVRPQPIGVNDTKTICSDASVAYDLQNNINTLGNALPATFSWVAASNLNVTGESTASQAGGTITDVLNNVTGVDQTVIYTVIPTSTLGCVGSAFTVTVTVRSEPVGGNDTMIICSDNTVTYDLQNNVNTLGNSLASTFSWIAAANANVTGESTVAQAGGTITDVLNNVTNLDQTVIYTVTPTGTNGCTGNPFTVTVTVHPEPLGVNDTKTICSDANVNYSLPTNISTLGNNLGATFSWIAAANANVSGESTVAQAGNVINDVLNNISGISQAVIYTVTPTSADGCVGNPFTVTVTVQSEPVGVNDVASICSDAAVGYILQNNINTLGNNIVSTFSWIATSNPNVSGESTTSQVGGTITNVLTNVTGVDQVVVYTVIPTSGGGCAGNPFTVSVTVRTEPVGVNDTKTICSDGNVAYDLTNNVATLGNNQASLFSWVAAANANVSGESTTAQAGANITDVLNNVSGADEIVVYTVTPTGTNGCAGNAFTVTVTVQSEPLGSNDLSSICSDQNVNYNLQNNINTLGNNQSASFSWIAAANPNVTGESTTAQAGNIINNVLNNVSGVDQVVVYTVTPTGTNGCAGNPFTVSITVRSEPLGVNDTKTICGNSSVAYDLQNNLTALGNGVTATFSWIAAANPNVGGESTTAQLGSVINNTLTNVTNANQVVVYTVTPTGTNGCAGNPFTVTVTVQPQPVGVTDADLICSDNAVNYDLQNNINTLGNNVASTFSWMAAVNANVSGESTAAQAGAIITDVLNNVTNVSQTVVYTVIPTSGALCVGAPFTITITVDPEPLGMADADDMCSDQSVSYSLQNNVNTLGNGVISNFSWVAAANASVAGESTVPQASGTITDVLTNLTNVDQVVVYTVTPTSGGGCLGNPFTVTITIHPEPLGAADAAAICSDFAVAYDLQNNVNTLGNGLPATFTWVAASNASVTGESTVAQAGATLTDVLRNVTGADQFVDYTVTPTGTNGCAGNTFLVTITVRPEPVMDPALATTTICSTTTSLPAPTGVVLNTNGISVAAATYDVALSSQAAGLIGVPTVGLGLASNAIQNDTYDNTTTVPLNVVYTVTPRSAAGCYGDPFNITVTVNPEPVVNPALDNSVCSRDISGIILSTNGTSVAAATYRLVNVTIPGTVTPDGANTIAGAVGNINLVRNDRFTNTTNAAAVVIYEVRGTSSLGCEGESEFINLTINPEPIMVPGTANLCSDVPSGIIVGPAVGSAITTQFELKSIVKAPALVAGGFNAGLGIYPANLAGGQADFLANDVFTNTTNAPLIVTYTIAPIAGGCRGTDQTVVFTVNPAPAMANNLDAKACSGGVSTIVLATLGTSAAAANYELLSVAPSAGLVVVTQAVPGITNDINYIANDAYSNPTNGPLTVTYNVQPITGAGCRGPVKAIVLTVEPNVVVNPSALTQTICSNSLTSVTLNSLTVPTAGTITYGVTVTASSGLVTGFIPILNNLPNGHVITDNLVNNDNTPQTVTYAITPVAAGARNGNGCTGPAVNVVVSVEPKPKITITPTMLTVCEGTATSLTLTTTTSPSVGNVTFEVMNVVVTGGVTGFSPIGSTFVNGNVLADLLSNPTTTTQTVTYTLRPRALGVGCEGDDTQVVVTVNPVPVVTASATTADICSGGNINISLTYDVANTIGQWTAVADPGVLGASPGAGSLLFQTLFNTTNAPANVIYTVTPNALGCNGTPINITVVVEPVPSMSGLPVSQVICDDGVLNVTLNSNVAGATFSRTATASSPGITGYAAAATGNTINETLSNSDIFAGSILYQVTPSFQRVGTSPVCVGNPGSMIVTVDAPVNGAFLNSDIEVCAGGTQFLIFSFSGSGPFDVQYSDGTSTIPLNNVGSVYPLQITPTATTTYTITRVEDLYGCVATPNVPVTAFVNQTDASFNVVGPTSGCTPLTAQFQYNQVAGTRYTWRWFDGNPDSVYVASTTEPGKIIQHGFINPSPSGTLTYKATLLTDVESVLTPGLFLCPDSETKNVQVYPTIFVNIFPDKPTTICSGEDITFFNSSLGVTSHRWFYREQGNIGQELDVKTTSIATFNFTNTTSNNPIIYEVVYQANNGNCPAETIETVTVYQGVTASFDEGTVPPFVGGNATVNFANTSSPVNTGVFRYDWDFGLDSSPNTVSGGGPFTVNYASPGPRDVILTATNILAEGNGLTCQSTYSETITILLPPLTAAFKAEPKAQCFPGEITVTENTATGDIYEWRVVDDAGITAAVSNAPLPVFTIVNPGIYTVILKTTNSITGQVAFQNDAGYEIYEKPQSSFEARPTILYVPDTEMATFNFSIGANFYNWDFGDGGTSDEFEPTYVYKVEGVYEISLIAGYDHGNGVQCTDTVKRQITARQGGLTKVPNAFTPSPNGPTGGQSGSGTFNDVFLPITRGVEEFNMQIFDRWGTLIFESNNQNVGWDGYDKTGKLMPGGVYVFKLTLRLSDGQRTTQIGDVTLIR